MDFKDTFFSRKSTINCNGSILDLTAPKIMGILNHTPDSFYDGGNYMSDDAIRERFNALLSEGADIVDIGCYSTKPGAPEISQEEEKSRLSNVFHAIKNIQHNSIISVDTFRSEIASFVVQEYGVSIINDISGGSFDEKMPEVIGNLKVPYVLMHIQGTPKTMQLNPQYDDVTTAVISFFKKRIALFKDHLVQDIIIDPGFGFGKTASHNFELLRNLRTLGILELPVLVGISRKSMIYNTLQITPEDALNGTSVLHTLALVNGANILRVHDVKEARETIALYQAYKND